MSTLVIIFKQCPPEKCTFLLKTPSGGKNDNRALKLFSQVKKSL